MLVGGNLVYQRAATQPQRTPTAPLNLRLATDSPRSGKAMQLPMCCRSRDPYPGVVFRRFPYDRKYEVAENQTEIPYSNNNIFVVVMKHHFLCSSTTESSV